RDVTCLDGVKYLMTGGEAGSVKHIQRAKEQWSEMQVVNGYWQSECTVFCSCYVVPGELEESAASLPIGQPIGDRRVYVLDPWMNPAPVGVVGEAFVAGAGVARGYVGSPEQTAEEVVPDPFSEESGARVYEVGDLVGWEGDGNLEVWGRV